MKKNLKTLLIAPLAFTVLAVLSSCDKENDNNNNNPNDPTMDYTVTGNATGDQSVPPVVTSANAKLTGTYSANNNKLEYTINWTGLSGVASEVTLNGPASAGVHGGVIVPLEITLNGVNGKAAGFVTVADSTEAHLINGKVYFNIYTIDHPDGEVRGQISLAARR